MDLIHCVLYVISACTLMHLTSSFNIDIKTAKIFRGDAHTGFGYSAEFIYRPSTGKTSLLVGAPRQPVTLRNESGVHYFCDPSSSSSTCPPTYSPSQPGVMTSDGRFGEDRELFGLAMTMADRTTAVMCGPMWTDMQHWRTYPYPFNIGRCHVFPSTMNSEGLAVYQHRKQYLGDIEIDGRVSRQMYYGAAEFGFSADGDGKGKVVIGAPGFSGSRGGVTVLDTSSLNVNLMNVIMDQEPDAVFGYDVTVGNFCGPERFCFAGSNRQVKGKVHVIEHIRETIFARILEIEGDQEYSSFGSTLCATDVTGDGWADLLVGAPTYSFFSNTTPSYDQGRVFVYISQGELFSGRAFQDNFVEGTSLRGDGESFARFGSAISSIGDINRDSINDIAVGAPLAEEGTGVVYIYLGTPNGPEDRYSQKIRGSDFNPPLSSFGVHISRPTSDFSGYGYPDFAVGAPDSSAVVFIRTRLIVNAQVTLEASPNPVDKINNLCSSISAASGRAPSGCVNIDLCVSFQFSATGLDTRSSQFRSLRFSMDLEVDRLITSDGARRIRFYNHDNGTAPTSHHLELTVPRDRTKCQRFTGILKQDQIDRNPFRPVEVHAAFSLNTAASTDIAPMLNQSMPTSVTEQVRFKNQCGQDNLCETNLVLDSHEEYVTDTDVGDLYHMNVINATKQVELVLDIVNKKETSFGMTVTVELTGQINFWTTTGNYSILCDELENYLLTCQGWTPLGENEAVQVRLKFLADSVPLEPQNRVIGFKVKVMPSDPTENPEVDESDNVGELESRTAIIADVRVHGSSTPGTKSVADSDQSDVALTHKLLVTNRGPSFLPSTVLNISLPVRDSAANDIVDAVNVTIKLDGSRVVVECPQILSAGSIVGSTTRPSRTTTTTTPSPTRPGGGTGPQTTLQPDASSTDNPFGGGPEILPSKRRRRKRQAADVPNDDGSTQSDGTSLRMDCGNYQCRIYQCTLSALQPKKQAEINVNVTLRRIAIVFPKNVETLIYTTTTSISEPDHALFYPLTEPRIREVGTRLKRVSSGDEINIWYIIGGVVGGLILLILIAVAAWWLGFFKRKDKARLERLKRQSGFYESRGSTKRKSQRAPSSNSNNEKE